MPKPKVDFSRIEQLVLCELQRQGVEFARVRAHENFSDFDTTHITVETFTERQLDPKYVEAMRISNQLQRHADNNQVRPCPLCGARRITFLINQNNKPCCAECGYPCHLYDEVGRQSKQTTEAEVGSDKGVESP